MNFRIKDLLNEDIIKKLIKNVATLFSGNIIAQVLGLITLALTTQLLGAELFGVLIVIQTYTIIMDKLVNFQSWQALIKFGTEAQRDGNDNEFKGLIKFSTLLDAVSALIATLLAILLIYWLAPLINLNEEYIYMCMIYCLSILFHLSGAPTAILRMYDKFKLIATIQVIVAMLKFVTIFALYLLEINNFSVVLVAWVLSEVISHLLLLTCGHYVLYKNNINKWWLKKTTRPKEFFSFTCWTNLSTTVNLPVKQFDILIVSWIISMEGVAVYKIFKQVAQICNKISDPVYQVIFPQLVKMVSDNKLNLALKYVKKVAFILALITIPIAVVISLFSPYWLNWIFGEIYADAWIVLALYLGIEVVSQSLIGVHPLFIALGYVKKNLMIMLITNISYLPLVFYLGSSFGLLGVVIAYGIQILLVILIKFYVILKS
ncbi:O-antigen/teichoic acid export membrane protein [Alkalihalobacillus xiaoxiensis]|uniref:O-antigen/teichoic acid export membrane protein n=1 Tax=Shouchella xiaoxiensis TaxID=766895 RepID=A0ABS2SYA1_9BACI|nr:oligosaccharide flippase family protein [Shouchella xiaoxiensis]MBM7839409.1 O-antigen/teichoic acid export membrane protein [Shouchella xiaoxiensis]